MIDFFGGSIVGEPFHWLSFSHVVMMGLLLVSGFVLFLFRTRLTKGKSVIRYTLALFLLISELSLYVWYVYTGVWDPIDSLPFQLCSISLFLSIIMLLTKSHLLFEVTYFLGIGGALQAMLTPELAYDFPHYRYFHFFLAHIAIILASLYMLWYENIRPTFNSVWKAFAALNVIACIVFFINKATGGNYMFLARKPINPSLIDFLGPYPWYLLSLELVALIMFFILYLPFIRKKN
ncbi:TIGR02206 family membrane protein [Fredinandcohnia sp. QZ13]|uniref:YwaF family protein n=1 Tax=Fredinandcohnia sp. QZ13 TaxID=3073144 RepID=UPI0028532371|nr:TIGR02206 family membrane protein [Fredinandcohnia sp. QZ13]MDR4889181.1 TIGR02206 family membrane protein [Fredinandcohnia sp. QZ13]